MSVTLRVVGTQTSQDISSNSSVVRVQVFIDTSAGSWNGYGGSGTVYVDGIPYSISGAFGSPSSWMSTKLYDVSFRIYHNADGTRKVNLSAGFSTGISPGYVDAYSTVTLTTIPRKTTVYGGWSRELGTAQIFELNRASSSFTHTLRYKFGSKSGTIGTNLGTTASWTPPLSLASEIPNSTKGTVTVYCDTYNGSTLIGTTSATATLTVPTSVVPLISSIDLSENETDIDTKFGSYVQSKSKIKGVISASSQYGATIKAYKIEINGTSYSTSTFTTDYLSIAGDNTCKVTVTDTRGRTAESTSNFNVLDYSPPKVYSFSVIRCDSSGAEDDDGSYVKVYAKASISPINNKNTKSFVVKYKKSTSSTYTTVTLSAASYALDTSQIIPNIDVDNEYDFVLEIKDYFTDSAPISNSLNVGSSFVLTDYNSSGRSIAFGKVSQRTEDETAFDVAMDAYFDKKIVDRFGKEITNGLTKYESSGIDPNTTLDHIILTNHSNRPSSASAYWYIMTLFDGNKTTTANRAQIAFPYSTKASLYHRYYHDGVWGAWRRLMNADEAAYLKVRVSSPLTNLKSGFITFNSTVDKKGSSFTLSGGRIIVGSGISLVRVHINIGCGAGSSNRAWAYIRRNDEYMSYGGTFLAYGDYPCMAGSMVMQVSEGDKIGVSVGEAGGVAIDGLDAILTVEKIE